MKELLSKDAEDIGGDPRKGVVTENEGILRKRRWFTVKADRG